MMTRHYSIFSVGQYNDILHVYLFFKWDLATKACLDLHLWTHKIWVLFSKYLIKIIKLYCNDINYVQNDL